MLDSSPVPPGCVGHNTQPTLPTPDPLTAFGMEHSGRITPPPHTHLSVPAVNQRGTGLLCCAPEVVVLATHSTHCRLQPRRT